MHDVYRRWHRVLAEYPGDRMTVAEAWTQTPESMARFVRSDEMSQAFNFSWLLAPWSARGVRRGHPQHPRAARRGRRRADLGAEQPRRRPARRRGTAAGRSASPAPAPRRWRCWRCPGSAYLYQGEELGLENVDVPEELRQDPAWLRTHRDWRDGCRVPIPWSGDAPPYGFGPGAGQPWLPQPLDWADRSVAAQEQDPDSTLAFYRAALAARRKHTSDTTEERRAARRRAPTCSPSPGAS